MALLDSDRTAGRPVDGVRLPVLPTQRTPGTVPSVDAVDPAPSAGSAGGSRRRPAVVGAVVVAAVLTVGIGATSVAVTVQHDAREAQAVHEASQVEAVAQASDSAFAHRLGVARTQQARAEHARDLADRAAAVAAATPAVDAARAALAATPQATGDTRAALELAIDGAAALLATDPPPQLADVDAAVGALAALREAVLESQAAWQVAEDARLAAEAAAQAAAAAEAAQAAQPAPGPEVARAPQAAASRSTRVPAAAPASAPQASAPAAASPAPGPAPAAGAAPEFSAGALGEAINAYRAANGLPGLSVSRSGGLYAHAAAMAQKGSIWHSGSDNIVGYVKPASASALVRAWANSPAHDAWMLKPGVSSMHVGAAVVDNKLYGAVAFG